MTADVGPIEGHQPVSPETPDASDGGEPPVVERPVVEPSVSPGRGLATTRSLPAGWRTIAAKEVADNLLSVRFVVLLIIVGLAAASTVYFSSQAISQSSQDIRSSLNQAFIPPSGFLLMFTVSQDPFPFPFFGLVGFVIPLIGIAFGFDAVNGERAQGTLPRLVAQPIYRDDVINGKFLGGIAVISLLLAALTAIVAGVGIVRLGIIPDPTDIVRLVAWLVVSIVYVGFWLAFSMLCSVVFRRAATSALVSFGVWLALTLFFGLIASLVGNILSPAGTGATAEQVVANSQTTEMLSRLSPTTLYQEATAALLNPLERTVAGVILPQQADRAIASTISVDQSLLLVWPQVVAMVALTVVVFAVAYVNFMRQEVRA
jgi:ABC-2 type transport system permease protein